MQSHIIHIQKWAYAHLPTEAELSQQMTSEGLTSQKWQCEPFKVFTAHEHSYDKVIYIVDGSITFGFPVEGAPTTLYPGDRLDLPAGILHNAAVGADGVVCLQAKRLQVESLENNSLHRVRIPTF